MLRFWNATARVQRFCLLKVDDCLHKLVLSTTNWKLFSFRWIFSYSTVQRLGEGSINVVQVLKVAISLCLRIAVACTIHRQPFYRRVGKVHAYPLLVRIIDVPLYIPQNVFTLCLRGNYTTLLT